MTGTDRTVVALTGAVMLLAALVASDPVAAQQHGPLTRTEPQHLGPVPPGGYQLPMSPPVVQFPRPPQLVVIRSTQDWRQAGQVSKELSRACAQRRFREYYPRRFRAIFKTEVLGVAFGHGVNLVDRDGKADRRMIYLFRNGDSTACVVIAMTNEDARVLNDAAPEPAAAGR